MKTYESSWNQWVKFCTARSLNKWTIDQLAACAFAVWRAFRQKGYGKHKGEIKPRKWKTIKKDFHRATARHGIGKILGEVTGKKPSFRQWRRLRNALKGIRRKQGDKPDQRTPVTVERLMRLQIEGKRDRHWP